MSKKSGWSLDSMKYRLREDGLITAEEWIEIFDYASSTYYPRDESSGIFELLYKHPLMDVSHVVKETGLGLSQKEFEWIGQNPIWPILLESYEYANNMVLRNAYKLLEVTIRCSVNKNDADQKQKIVSTVKSWMAWMGGRFRYDHEESNEFFKYLVMTFPNLKLNYSSDDYADVEDDIGNILYCYEFKANLDKEQALLRLSFLLEETFSIPHHGHLLSFLETP